MHLRPASKSEQGGGLVDAQDAGQDWLVLGMSQHSAGLLGVEGVCKQGMP